VAKIKKTAAVNDIVSGGIPALWSLSESQQLEVAEWSKSLIEQEDRIARKYHARIKRSEILPFSKQELKMAIKIQLLIQIADRNDELIDSLKRRYLRIASYQHVESDATGGNPSFRKVKNIRSIRRLEHFNHATRNMSTWH
jgi:RNase P subunit RPR2